MRDDSDSHENAPAAGWSLLLVDLAAPLEEAALACLTADCLGVESQALPDGRVRLIVCHGSPEAARRAARDAVVWLRPRQAARVDGRDVRVVRQPDDRWVERYQSALRPFDLGRRFRVVPGELGEAEQRRIVLRLVPGRAFGTGEHPTTRLCAQQLETAVEPGSRWIDLGCGSGILSLIAHHCGAAYVRALDLDPDAVEVAREVLAANGIPRARVEALDGTLEPQAAARQDGIVANIVGPYFLEHASLLFAHLVPGGRLVAAGFLDDESPRVESALARAGLTIEQRAALDGWGVVVARRSA